MKTRPEENALLRDVFDGGGALRDASLNAMLRTVRQSRRTRSAARLAAVGTLLGVIAFMWAFWPASRLQPRRSSETTMIAGAPRTVPGTHVRLLTDDELLALFPNRPVALMGPATHRRLVFLDEQQN